jgi:RNA polymerase-binding transcription factor
VNTRALDRQTIGELERFLRDDLARLETSLRAIARENRTAEKTGLTDVSLHAADTLQTEMQVTLVDRRTRQVAQILDALERLSHGQYGLCQDCEGFVGVARLRALPFAQRCRECQSQTEQRARREALAPRPELPGELEAA